jgi:hypothetical protein
LVSEIQRETSYGRVVNSRPNCRGAHRHRIGLLRNEAREKIAREAVADAPVNICEKKKGWSSRNGPRSHGWLADIQRNAGCDKEMGLNAA